MSVWLDAYRYYDSNHCRSHRQALHSRESVGFEAFYRHLSAVFRKCDETIVRLGDFRSASFVAGATLPIRSAKKDSISFFERVAVDYLGKTEIRHSEGTCDIFLPPVTTIPAMEGTVYAINSAQDLIAVDTSSGFSIFEQINPDFEIGDFVKWSPENQLGACDIRNVSKGRISRIYFQNHRVPGTFLKVNLQL